MPLTGRRLRVSLGVGRGISNLARHKFVDHVRVQVLGGGGGKGIIAFESLDNVKQRPVGGHGGRGGDIIIEASRTVRDLNFQTFVIRGHDGGMATGNGKNGKAGKPKKVVVPLGTVVREVFRTYDYAAGEGTDDDPALAEDAVFSLNRGSSASGLLPALSGGSANTWESSDDEEALPSVVTVEADAEAAELSVDAADDSGTSAQRTGRKSSPRMRLRASSDDNLAEDDAFSDEIDVEDDWGGPAAVASAVSASAASAASSEAKGRSASRDTTRERISKSGIPFSETNVTLVDLNTHGQQLVVATGGSPGVGNRGSQLFYAAQVRGHDKPHISGRPGQVRTLDLELKSIADVGLVGFPNAGKSSFLGAVSKVRACVTTSVVIFIVSGRSQQGACVCNYQCCHLRTPCSLCWCVVSRIGSADTSYATATAQVPNRDIAL